MPYVSPAGYHRHECWKCGLVYEHHNCNDMRHQGGDAHECPRCGKCGWAHGIYEGEKEPEVRNGKEPGSEE